MVSVQDTSIHVKLPEAGGGPGPSPLSQASLGPRRPSDRTRSPGEQGKALSWLDNLSGSPGPQGNASDPLCELTLSGATSPSILPPPLQVRIPPDILWGPKRKKPDPDRREGASGLPLTHKKHLPHAGLQEAYYLAGDDKAAMRFRDCGRCHVVYTCSSTGAKWRNTWRCHDRLCPTCAPLRAGRLLHQYWDRIWQPGLRRLVLTIPSVKHISRDTFKSIRRHFAALRRRKAFRHAFVGGIYAIETTWNPRHGWHVHIHCLFEGHFIPQALLKKHWHDITGDAEIVWIGVADKPYQEFKYILKPDPLLDIPVPLLAEFIRASKGMRLVQPFGSWHACHGRKRRDHDPDQDPAGDDPLVATDAHDHTCLPCPYCGGSTYTRVVLAPRADVSEIPWARRDWKVGSWLFDP